MTDGLFARVADALIRPYQESEQHGEPLHSVDGVTTYGRHEDGGSVLTIVGPDGDVRLRSATAASTIEIFRNPGGSPAGRARAHPTLAPTAVRV
jgi:hypothetical protein